MRLDKTSPPRPATTDTGTLFRSGQRPGDEMVLEGDYGDPASLIVDVQRTLARQGRRFTTAALRPLVTDADGDGRYEIDTTSLGRGAYLYLRGTLPKPMFQYVNAALTTAGSPNTVLQTRIALAHDLSEILGRPVSQGDKETVVEALQTLRSTGDTARYAIVKERYLNAYFAHIGGEGDVVETFRMRQTPLLPTIYGERNMAPVTIGDCNALAEISRDLDQAAGVKQTRFIGIRVTDEARPGKAVGHRMLLSRLDEGHYLISNNTDQHLIPVALIAEYGWREPSS